MKRALGREVNTIFFKPARQKRTHTSSYGLYVLLIVLLICEVRGEECHHSLHAMVGNRGGVTATMAVNRDGES